MPNHDSQPGNARSLPDSISRNIDLETITLPAKTLFYRIHSAAHSPFYYFRDEPTYRFDDPLSEFGALYISRDQIGAFAETIARQLFAQTFVPTKIIFLSRYKDRLITTLRSKKPMVVVNLNSNANALRLRVTAELMSHDDYSWTQQWSRGLYENHAQFDGIYYQAKHAPESPSVAVFERFPEESFERLNSTPLGLDTMPLAIAQYLEQAGFTLRR